MMATISAREFNRDVSAAKRAAKDGPVVITDRGKPDYVLMSIEEYRRIEGSDDGRSIAEALRMDEDIDIEFEPPRVASFPRAAEF